MTEDIDNQDPQPEPPPIYPHLDDIVKPDDVAKKGGSGFKAEYVNWARIAHYLRLHAPGWQPFMERDEQDRPYHQAPDGSIYLLIGFRHPDPDIPDTQPVVHAVMDHQNHAIPSSEVDARDISDAFVRGMCKAAALLFGLGWKLWSKDDPMARGDEEPKTQASRPSSPRSGGGGGGGKATEKQGKMFWAVTRKLDLDEEQIATLLNKNGVAEFKELTVKQASELLKFLDEKQKQAAGGGR